MSKATTSLNLTADQVNTLREICMLVVYSDGFTYSREQEAVCKRIADQSPAFERLRTLTRAADEERIQIYGPARRAAA
jgi:hypothetical protein